MKKLLNTVILALVITIALAFLGVLSAMAFTTPMAVNQGGLSTDAGCLQQNPGMSSALNYLEETRPFPTDISRTALATPEPAPTYHVGKIQLLMV